MTTLAIVAALACLVGAVQPKMPIDLRVVLVGLALIALAFAHPALGYAGMGLILAALIGSAVAWARR